MPSRIIPFVNDHFYHIYNRGSEKRPIFENQRDYQRFLKTLRYYQLEGPKPKLSHFSESSPNKPDPSKKIVEIIIAPAVIDIIIIFMCQKLWAKATERV